MRRGGAVNRSSQKKASAGRRKHLSVVLVEPSLPENVGAVARVMGNFGVRDLRLVRPCEHLGDRALALATHSADILRTAHVFPDLPIALADRRLVIATSARPRDARQRLVALSDLAAELPTSRLPTAIVFGRESSGLTVDEMAMAQWAVRIPTAPGADALNLSHAVAVLLYALTCADEDVAAVASEPPSARTEELHGLLDHCMDLLDRVGFVKSGHGPRIRRLFGGMFARMRPTTAEARAWRGFFHRVEVTLERAVAGRAEDDA